MVLRDTSQELILLAFFFLSAAFYLGTRWKDDAVYDRFKRIRGRAPYWLTQTPVHEVVQKGYQEVTSTQAKPFVVRWWARDYLVLPPKYLADLRSADWYRLSFFTNISDALYLHTTVGDLYQSRRMVDVVTRGINPRLPKITTAILPVEADHALCMELGEDTEHWRSLPAAKTLIAVSHRTATRLMVSDEMANDEAFVQASMAFVESIFTNAMVIVKLPLGPLRGLLAYPLSLTHKLKLSRALNVLLPSLKKRIVEYTSEVSTVDLNSVRHSEGGGGHEYNDAIQWTLAFSNGPPDARENTAKRIGEELLHGLWAGSSAPGGLLTDLLFQVLLKPEYLAPLIAEAEAALALHGGKEKRWTESVFSELRLLDSFIRETNRIFPTGSVTCSRTVGGDRPFAFSDGLILPPGTRFGFPIKAMQSDPAMFADPEVFDGFRFALHGEKEMQQLQKSQVEQGQQEQLLQALASTVDTTNLAFGYGTHACPGRFYAIRAVKLIFTKLILNYEFQWEGEVAQRPAPVFVEGQFVPNMTQRVRFRRRRNTPRA